MTVAGVVDRLPRRVAGWATSLPLSLAPNSMAGISIALGVCAAVWFSAGTRPGNAVGALALCASYLASRSARQLAARRQAALLPGQAGPLTAQLPTGRTAAGHRPARAARAKAVSDGRLARVCAVTTECAAYAGLAVGGAVGGSLLARSLVAGGPLAGAGMWRLATIALIVVAVSQLAVACGHPAVPGMPREVSTRDAPPGEIPARQESAGETAARRATARVASPRRLGGQVLGMPYGGRVLLIAVVAPVLGARGAFLGLLGWAVIAVGYTLVSSRPRRAGAWGARIIAACRDDGLIATEIGLPVRGQLVPVPPALTGVAAVTVLAILGLRNLPGLVLLAPVVAMLLAAVGSSHPHDGPVDWIVPVLLQAGQFAYIAAIGVATGVPAPLIFAVCALIALHYADLAGYPRRGTILGWEGRMIAAGLGAALGLATFAYLLLAAYLGVLICREFMTSWLPATEGDRR